MPASATDRVSGPATESPPTPDRPGIAGTRPRLGFNPTSPVAAAGIRTDPPPSLPIAAGSSPAATATAAPLELPPGARAVSYGLRVVPKRVSEDDDIPNSARPSCRD